MLDPWKIQGIQENYIKARSRFLTQTIKNNSGFHKRLGCPHLSGCNHWRKWYIMRQVKNTKTEKAPLEISEVRSLSMKKKQEQKRNMHPTSVTASMFLRHGRFAVKVSLQAFCLRSVLTIFTYVKELLCISWIAGDWFFRSYFYLHVFSNANFHFMSFRQGSHTPDFYEFQILQKEIYTLCDIWIFLFIYS